MINHQRVLGMLWVGALTLILTFGSSTTPVQARQTSVSRNYGLHITATGGNDLCPGMTATLTVTIMELKPFRLTMNGETQTGTLSYPTITPSATVSVLGSTLGSITPRQGQGAGVLGTTTTFTYVASQPGEEVLSFSAEIVDPATSERKYADHAVKLTIKDCAYKVALFYEGELSADTAHFSMTGYTDDVTTLRDLSGGGMYTESAPFTFKVAMTGPECRFRVGTATVTAHFAGSQTNEALELNVNIDPMTLSVTAICPKGSATVAIPWLDPFLWGQPRFTVDLESLKNPLTRVFVEPHQVLFPIEGYNGGVFTLFIERVTR